MSKRRKKARLKSKLQTPPPSSGGVLASNSQATLVGLYSFIELILGVVAGTSPHKIGVLVFWLALMFIVSMKYALHGDFLFPPRPWVVAVLIACHAAAISSYGWYLRPRLEVSPSKVTFNAPNSSFSIQVKNQTPNDVYNVWPVLHVVGQANSQDWIMRVDDQTSLKYLGSVKFYGFVCDDLKGGYVVLPIIPQIDSGQEARVVVTYIGTAHPSLIADTPRFATEPLPQQEAHDVGGGRWEAAFDMKLPMPLGQCVVRPTNEGGVQLNP